VTHAAGQKSYVALCGGVGGAKLALGLSRALAPGQLTIIVNTGDDFEHLGLHVSPDIDTVLYTLAGLANPELGWGLAGETWGFMAALGRLGGPTWFRLGDHDLATHVTRTGVLRSGHTLSEATRQLADRLDVGPHVVPMSDAAVRTFVHTDEGRLPFQRYFVERRCEPKVTRIDIAGAATAKAAPGALAALTDPELAGIMICPSNPWLSIDPLLAIPELRAALAARAAPCVAVTPIVAGAAIKGPTAKIMAELGLALDAATVARHYGDLIDGFVLDETDRAITPRIGLPVALAQTIMRTLDDRVELARATVAFCTRLCERTA
jgi:LPPG:FO 2-phospho-L-lactate transferase